MREESGGIVFLRYALPVLGYCNDARVEAEELADFIDILKTGRGEVDIGRLEELFPNAVPLLESWSPEHVRDYWLGAKGHNRVVGNNFACRTYTGKVLKLFDPAEDEVCQARIVGLEKIPLKSYVGLFEGDDVSLHNFQISERLSPEIAAKYIGQRAK